MTAIALAPAPAPVLVQVERLGAELERPDLDVVELMDIHDRAVVVQSYIKEANLSFDLWFDASVARLRSERRVGQLLERLIATSPPWNSHRDDRRMRVPRGLLKQLAVSGSQSSRWRYIASLSEQDFEDALRTARAARREITTSALVRLARRAIDSPTHGGRPRLSTRTKLRRILEYMRDIRHVQSAQERQLLRNILEVALGWRGSLEQSMRAGRPDVIQRSAACMLCARQRPPGMPTRCACGGRWLVC